MREPKPLEWIERYELPSSRQTHEGWAIVHIDSKGFLGIVSDFGDYAYHWSSFGDDFKKFICGCDSSYLHGKLAHPKNVYDGEATLEGIRLHIQEFESAHCLDPEEAQTERELLKDFDSQIRDSSEGFSLWHNETGLNEAHEFYCTKAEPQCLAFLEKVWPHVVKLIQAGSAVPVIPKPLPPPASVPAPTSDPEAPSVVVPTLRSGPIE